jgi:hypothetical protein
MRTAFLFVVCKCHCEPPLVECREAVYRDQSGVAVSSNQEHKICKCEEIASSVFDFAMLRSDLLAHCPRKGNDS